MRCFECENEFALALKFSPPTAVANRTLNSLGGWAFALSGISFVGMFFIHSAISVVAVAFLIAGTILMSGMWTKAADQVMETRRERFLTEKKRALLSAAPQDDLAL